MNRIHRTIWNPRRSAYMVVSEAAPSRGKASTCTSGALLSAVLIGTAGPALAGGAGTLPTGAQVSAGQAQISHSGHTLTVTQGSAKAAINWSSFSVGKDATVNFVQPGSTSVVLNRVTGREGSVIDGALNANGQVFILNPNGVLFGKGARVDTAGLVASTMKLSDADFMAGKTSFSGTGGAVTNQGRLSAHDGGYVVLMGQQVRNDGVIAARLGSVALAAGRKVSLNFNGDSLVGVVVDEAALDALVANGGAVRADGGLVMLTARGADGLLNTVVNNTGEVRAQTIENTAGRIYLLGEGGAVEVAGVLDASAPGAGDGGFVETSGPQLRVHDGARVSTTAAQGRNGTWLIDPTDFTISAGSASQTGSGIGASTLQTALAAGNVTIQTQASGSEAGNINVNAAVAWNANQLGLEAHGDVNVNAVMTASGTSTLDIKTGYNFNSGAPTFNAANSLLMGMNSAGAFIGRIDFVTTAGGTTGRVGSGILTINNQSHTLLNSIGVAGAQTSSGNFNLQGLAHNSNLAGRFVLAYDIDASASSQWNGAQGFVPIGSSATPFTGTFDGLGHTITGLTVARPSTTQVGLFGRASNAALRNIGMQSVAMTGSGNVGGLIGTAYGGMRIRNVWTSGSVSTTGALAGGVIGEAQGFGTVLPIRNVHSSANVQASNNYAGGLIGASYEYDLLDSSASGTATALNAGAGGISGDFEAGTMTNTRATGAVTANEQAGGAVGYLGEAALDRVSASGTVTAPRRDAGGLVGYMDTRSTVQRSSASGNVSGGSNLGGLIGYSYESVLVADSHASGNVTGSDSSIGGLIGFDESGGEVTVLRDSYATGNVSGRSNVGGLVGESYEVDTILRVYATGTVNGVGSAIGGLIGEMDADGYSVSQVSDAYATGSVTGSGTVSSGKYIGGLIGELGGGNLTRVYATGNVRGVGTNSVGGLIGRARGVTMSLADSYATGSVTSTTTTDAVGGLIGWLDENAAVRRSYATGAVSSQGNFVGGLVGGIQDGSSITDSYARGSVSGANYVAGLAGGNVQLGGSNVNAQTITRAYSTGAVTATGANRGGLFADPVGMTVTDSFWDTQTSGQATSVGGTGRTTAQMTSNATYTGAGWDFTFRTGTWGRKDPQNNAYPVLRAFGYTDPLTLTLTSTSRNYGDANPSLSGLTVTGCPTVNCLSGVTFGSAITATTGIGTYAYSLANALTLSFASGFNASDFDITLPSTGLVISPRPITLAVPSQMSRSYDGTALINGALLSVGNLVNGDSLSVAGSAALASGNVGNQAVTGLSGLTLNNPNYTVGSVTATGTVSITPRTLNISVAVADRVFDGTRTATATATDNRLPGDQLAVQLTAAFADTSVGTGKPVTLTHVALSGADAGNYLLAPNAGAGATGNLLARSLTYTLAARDAARTYTATGQPLVTAATIDQFVVSSFANTVSGAQPGTLSYTLWRNGQQVAEIVEVGSYEVRASFAAADPNYAIATSGNTNLTLSVQAEAAVTTPVEVALSDAVRTSVATRSAVIDALGVEVPPSLVDFNPTNPNVAIPLPNLTQSFGDGVPLSLLSSPDRTEPTEGVTLEQARRMVKTPAGSATTDNRDVRVPVSRNSLAEIVNGGVKLPSGVDQMLFVVKAGQ